MTAKMFFLNFIKSAFSTAAVSTAAVGPNLSAVAPNSCQDVFAIHSTIALQFAAKPLGPQVVERPLGPAIVQQAVAKAPAPLAAHAPVQQDVAAPIAPQAVPLAPLAIAPEAVHRAVDQPAVQQAGDRPATARPVAHQAIEGSVAQAIDRTIESLLQRDKFLTPAEARGEANANLMYGFESEYEVSQTSSILKFYAPNNMPKAQWLAMSDTEHIDWLTLAVKNRRLGQKQSGLTKIVDDPSYAFLPDYPIIDDTGNLELVVGPAEDFATWKGWVTSINHLFGVGSQQSMISVPKKFLFPQGRDNQQSYGEVLGTFNFLNTFDTLTRMNEGALRFQKDPSKIVLRSFAHPFLGPMTAAKQTMMKAQMQSMAAGQAVYFDSATAKSPKFIGSTTPRPDIGARVGRIGAEVRDAHNREDQLIENTERMSLLMIGDRRLLAGYQTTKAVDTKLDFATISPDAQLLLSQLFPVRRDQTFGAPDEVFALEVYRNFAFPLKSWSEDLSALGREDLNDRVQAAQLNYRALLTKVALESQAGELSTDAAKAQIQGACANFANESGLFGAYSRAYGNIMGQVSHELLNEKVGP